MADAEAGLLSGALVSARHITFVTGRLAEPSLREVVAPLAAARGFEFRIAVLEVSVAALLTTRSVARRLKLESPTALVLLPGYCGGDLPELAAALGVAVERGPKDLRALPRWFEAGLEDEARPEGYGERSIEILAEINHAPRLSTAALLTLARRHRADGADLIDVGCEPDGNWRGVAEAVRALRDEGFRVAIDSFDPLELRAAADAGAELALSIHGGNLAVARDLACEVVVIPDEPRTLGGFDETIAKLGEWKVRCRLDPILEPVGIGFAASLGRFLEVRRRYPEHRMLMGVGNVSELLDADSAAVNTLLIGFCEELGVSSVLTTEVVHWARGSVREIDLARRLMFYALSRGVLPKHLEPGLHILRDPQALEHGEEALRRLAASIQDPSFRLFAERGELHVMNRDGYWRGANAFALFDQLGVTDPSHAFYLGWELAKASIALQLGKEYHQDRSLRWGYLSVEETSHLEAKRRRAREDDPGEGGAPGP